MKKQKGMKRLFRQWLCLFLCVTIVTTGIQMPPVMIKAAETVQKKFIKTQPEVFVPSLGEKTKITFNLESKRKVNIYVKDGLKVIATLAANKEYQGNYIPQEIQWDGKDENGNYVKSGTYKIIVEPEGKYKEYKSIANVSVVADNREAIYIAPNRQSSTFQIYGKGGKAQGIKKVSISVQKDGKKTDTLEAAIDKNLWHVKLPMSSYSLYDLTAEIQGSSGTTTSHISAVLHTFRITDRLEYLASSYYGDYKKDYQIKKDNGLYDTYTNSGELVGTNLLIINPIRVIQQEISSSNQETNQHLGVIDQIQRIASMKHSSLTMGNFFYNHVDLAVNGSSPLILSRSYNSMAESFHEFSFNWTHSYTYFLQDLGDAIAIRFGDGHIETYTKKKDGAYTGPKGLARELTENENGSYTLVEDGQNRYTFTRNGRLREISDWNGNATVFSYTDGFLTKVENDSGFLEFFYHADGAIWSVKDSGKRKIEYGYTNGLLTSFTDAQGNTTRYFYDSHNRLNKVVSPQKAVLYEIVYDSSDRVKEKTIQGSTYQYSYQEKERTILCTEPNGNKITYRYTKDYRIESEEDADGITRYSYEKDTKEKQKADLKEEEGEEERIAQNKEVEENKASGVIKKMAKSEKIEGSDYELKKDAIRVSSIALGEQEKETASDFLSLQTQNINVCTGDQTFNTIYPQFRIYNHSQEEISLSDLTLRYYYTIDGETEQVFWCDWSSIGAKNVTGKFVKLAYPTVGADYYVEVGFTKDAGKLEPGNSIDLHTRIGKKDWSDFIPGDDYSQNTSPVLSYFDQVDMFYQGNLVWGKGTIPGEEAPPTGDNNGGNENGGEEGDLPGNNGNESDKGNENDKEEGSQNETNSTEEEIIPKGYNRLKIKMYHSGGTEPFANTIHPMMQLVNMGENMVKLSDVKIRYYYTSEGETLQKFWCDWSDAGTDTVTGTFHKLEDKLDGADTYLEIGFTEEAGFLDIGAVNHISVRIAKEDWSSFDLTNDHSIRFGTEYEDWDKVDVFVNGEKVWGKRFHQMRQKRWSFIILIMQTPRMRPFLSKCIIGTERQERIRYP